MELVMGIHRHQFSGILIKPVTITPCDAWPQKKLDFGDSQELILDGGKKSPIASLMTKPLRKKLRETFEKTDCVFDPNEIFGHTINGVCGEAFAVEYGHAPKRTIYSDEQFVTLETQLKPVLDEIQHLLGVILGQPVTFNTERVNDFEYWC
jgi:hypothetical protein